MSYPVSSESSDSPEGVTFLTALLIRFKEIGSARLCRNERLLTMDFYILRDLPEAEFQELESQLVLHLDVLCMLQRTRPRHVLIKHGHGRLKPRALGADATTEPRGLVDLHKLLDHPIDEEGLHVQSVTVERDLDSIGATEISLIVSWMSERFGRNLATNEDVPSEESSEQEESFYRSLERVRSAHADTDLTGFRDDMRVLIYSSAEPAECA
jgi:hypothetical protein